MAPGAAAPAAVEAEESADESNRGRMVKLLVLAAVLAVAVGGYLVRNKFKSAPAPKPAVKAGAPKATTPEASKNAAPTPSETLNKLAHAPANAINKAQEAIATRRASGQTRIDAAANGEDVPDKPLIPPPGAENKPAAATAARPTSTTTTTVGPGVTATMAVDAAAEANAAFRSFVANAKISGVFQGTPSRVVVNGRLIREGEVVDPPLGIVFNGIDASRHQLVFKDKSGATVSRRF